MTCEEATKHLLERLAGGLDERTCTALDEHLRECAGCHETSVVQREVSSLLASRPEADVPPAFAARVAERLVEESGWFGLADWRWLSVRFAPVAALLVLVAGIVIERQAAESSSTVSLSAVVETWATGESDSDSVPVTSVLWQQNASGDSALMTVLTAPADARIVRRTDER